MDEYLATVKGKKWVIVGDHKQLLPIFRTGDESLQERLSAFNHLLSKYPGESLWLNRHYRSNTKIIGFPQKHVYENKIAPDLPRCDNVKLELQNHHPNHRSEVLDPDKPEGFIHIDGVGLRSLGSTYNDEELRVCSELVDMLLGSASEPTTLA